MIVVGATPLNILAVLVTIPMMGLAVLAAHERGHVEYRHVKKSIEENKKLKQKPPYDLTEVLKENRTQYIGSIILAIIWNISAYIVMTLSVLMKYG